MPPRPTPLEPGSRYGALTILSDAPSRVRSDGKPDRFSLARCDCGRVKEYRNKRLRFGNTVSCGECATRATDMSGSRFGHLIAVRPSDGARYRGVVQWICECDCSRVVVKPGSLLRNGSVTSCGHGCPAKRYDEQLAAAELDASI